MKKIMIVAALLIGMFSATELNAQGHHNCDNNRRPAIGKEQIKQQKRIQHGKHTGQLNRTEAHRLQAEQRHIQQLKQMAKADGRVTRRERAIIQQEQDKASAHIYRGKHNYHRN